jgi:hypothetical protein
VARQYWAVVGFPLMVQSHISYGLPALTYLFNGIVTALIEVNRNESVQLAI